MGFVSYHAHKAEYSARLLFCSHPSSGALNTSLSDLLLSPVTDLITALYQRSLKTVLLMCIRTVFFVHNNHQGTNSQGHFFIYLFSTGHDGFPVAQMVEHGASNAKIMGSILRKARADKM